MVSSTNKTDHHDIPEILLKVALNTINQTYSVTSNHQTHTKQQLPLTLNHQAHKTTTTSHLKSSNTQTKNYCLMI
jgi:hypothetical protein